MKADIFPYTEKKTIPLFRADTLGEPVTWSAAREYFIDRPGSLAKFADSMGITCEAFKYAVWLGKVTKGQFQELVDTE